MNTWFRPLALSGLCALTLSACALFDKDDELVVAELVDFEHQFEAKTLWKSSIGNGVGEHASRLRPAVSDDKVYAASRTGEVAAFDKVSGKEIWQIHLGEKSAEHWFARRRSAMISGGITAQASQLLLGTERGLVYSLDPQTGVEQWKAVVAGEVLAPPAVEDDIVVVNTLSGKVYGLNAQTGEEIWRFENLVPPLTLRGLGMPAIANGGVFMGTPDGKLNALILDRGFQIWEEQITAPSGSNDLERMVDVDADVIVAGETVYAVAYNGDLMAADLRSGRETWKRPYSSYQGMVMDGFQLYLSNTSSYVYAIDRRDAVELWANLELENRQITSPAYVGSYVVVGDLDGYLHWLDGNTGSFVARMEVDSDGLYVPPVVEGNVMYVQSRDGDLYAIETP